MSYTAPNQLPYSSNLYPITTRVLTIKRGDGSTAGGGGSPTSLGTYLAENFSTTRPSTIIDRKGTSGQDKGEPQVIRQKITFSCSVQIDLTTTNTLRPGDFFEEVVDVDAGTVSTNKVRFIIGTVTKGETAGNAQTFNLDGVEDMIHSSQYGGS